MKHGNKNIPEAFWLSPDKEIYPVVKHISFISDNLELFGLSRTEYHSYFERHKEPYGFEGKARNEIVQKVIEQGWIRLRNYKNKGWVCELWIYNKEAKVNLRNWLKKYYSDDLKNNKSVIPVIEIHEISKYLEGMPETEWSSLFTY